MTVFEMIKYHRHQYPPTIPIRMEEVAAHFDINRVFGNLDWSLHTEYSFGKRKLDGELIAGFPEIILAHKNGIPQLWKSEEWACQFADFIVKLTKQSSKLKVIEIHPPFSDYTDIKKFISIYSIFEKRIKAFFPQVEILIENRCGSYYSGGKFIISEQDTLEELCNMIDQHNLALKIAYDVPQIYTAHNAVSEKDYIRLLQQAKSIRAFIGGVHLWGKGPSQGRKRVPHCGDLSSYFGNEAIKRNFLHAFHECFCDDVPRKMVLEVNSGNQDLLSIIDDLWSVDIEFIEPGT